ncbi:MAG: hypothetical protein U1E53_06935 [Dongiaceae bacterium]
MTDPVLRRHPRWRRVRVVTVRPPGTPERTGVAEVALSLRHGLEALGCDVDLGDNEPIADGVNIYLRAHRLDPAAAARVPPGSVIYNLEQIYEASPWLGQTYRDLLGRFTVWDYSRRNLAAIAAMAEQRNLQFVPLGYVPQLTRIAPATDQDIDLLFYGRLNQHRRTVLAEMARSGLRLRIGRDLRDAERDALIARARLVLNLHFYPTAIFEIVRVSYLLANGKAVVAECGPATEIDDDMRAAVAAVPRERLCETVLALLRDDAARHELGRRGQAIFARRRLPEILAHAIAATEAGRRPVGIRSGLRTRPLRLADAAALPPPRATRGGRRPRVLFHAINGSGIGHLMRLSVIAAGMQDAAETGLYSSCPVAERFWPGRVLRVSERLDARFELGEEQRKLLGLHLAVNRFAPEVAVFDTHWPDAVPRRLAERGIRGVLVLRAHAETMEPALRRAARDFETVLVPHHPAELEWIYRDRPDLLERLASPPCLLIGPIARTAMPGSGRGVIFSVGGGGEYYYRTEANSIDRFLGAYRAVAVALRDRLGLEPILASGPLLERPEHELRPFTVVRSDRLHEMFGPGMLVVSRGGYNTTWEAVAAGSPLVVVGEHTIAEDIGARGRFLQAEGLARQVPLDASAILEACLDLAGRPPASPDQRIRRSINVGLEVARAAILQGEVGGRMAGAAS